MDNTSEPLLCGVILCSAFAWFIFLRKSHRYYFLVMHHWIWRHDNVQCITVCYFTFFYINKISGIWSIILSLIGVCVYFLQNKVNISMLFLKAYLLEIKPCYDFNCNKDTLQCNLYYWLRGVWKLICGNSNMFPKTDYITDFKVWNYNFIFNQVNQ